MDEKKKGGAIAPPLIRVTIAKRFARKDIISQHNDKLGRSVGVPRRRVYEPGDAIEVTQEEFAANRDCFLSEEDTKKQMAAENGQELPAETVAAQEQFRRGKRAALAALDKARELSALKARNESEESVRLARFYNPQTTHRE